jgi:hypothetical protein
MRTRFLAAMLVLIMAAPAIASAFAKAPARLAHEKFKIVGSVVKVLAEEIHIKAVDGATYEIDFPDNTPVTRKLKKVGRAELKPGVKVIVNALGHDMFDLEAVEVQLVD